MIKINLDLIEQDFWETYPALKYKNPFSKIANLKTNSSKTMWAICLFIDINSPWRTMDEEARKEEIIQSYIPEDKKVFENPLVLSVIEEYPNAIMSEAERAFYRWGNKLRQRFDFIDKIEYTLDEYDEEGKLIKGTASQLDKMLADTHKLFQEYEKIEKTMIAENQKGRIKGGREETLSEKKIL